jgi:hypothetical protein
MADVLDFTGKPLVVDPNTGGLTPDAKEQALEMIQKCVNMLQEKVDSKDIEGVVLLLFNKNDPTLDYFSGSIKMSDLSYTLQTMLHKIHADSLMTMEEYDD